MPAGVHPSVVLALEVGGVVLLQREGIHIAAQQHGGAGLARIEVGDDRRGRLAERDVETEAGERLGDLRLRLREVQAEFGVVVDRPPQLDRVGVEGFRSGGEIGSEFSEAHEQRWPIREGLRNARSRLGPWQRFLMTNAWRL